MNAKTRMLTLLAAACVAATVSSMAGANEHPAPDEVEFKVPELFEFHDVIYPLWHHAWPEKDYAMMKELLPEVRRHVEKVREAELPGILRDKKAQWDEGVRKLEADLERYEAAAEIDDEPALLKTVEELHAHFEGMIRLIFPVMKELDAYHRVLYGIYHYDMPGKNVEHLRTAAQELSSACDVLQEAEIPERFLSEADALRPEFEALCRKSEHLTAVAAEDDWPAIEEAVESVHSQYQKVEGLF